jgi:hypothetical protein
LPKSDLDFAQNENQAPTLANSHLEFRTMRVLLQSGLQRGG